MNIPLDILVLLLLATAFLVVAAMTAWDRSRDPLHPVLWLSVLFFFGLVVEPFLCLRHPEFVKFFPDFRGVWTATIIQYAGMVSLFVGILSVRGPRFESGQSLRISFLCISDTQRVRLLQLAWILACLGVAAYWYAIYSSGGFFHVYLQPKGSIQPFSGYQGEAINLSLAGVVIYALAVHTKKLTKAHLITLLVFVHPVLLLGTFGGRRGPLFLAMTTLFFAWHMARARLPRPRTIVLFAVFCLLALVFVHTQRRVVYLGSDQTFDLERFWSGLHHEELTAGNNFVVSTGQVLVQLETGSYGLGRTYLIHFVVRPIPRQLWPTKYEDAKRMLYGEGSTVMEATQSTSFQTWYNVLGWRPVAGMATNTIVEFFHEFSWLFLLPCWLLGRGFGRLWANFRLRGELWAVIYALSMALSIYLPTQSFTAFAHRWLYISVITLLVARLVLRTPATRTPRLYVPAQQVRRAPVAPQRRHPTG